MKSQPILLDTGPLVAAINPRDTYHQWIIQQLSEIKPPFLTGEAVISEACFLSYGRVMHLKAIFEWMNNGSITISCLLENEKEAIEKLMMKYVKVPMSFADACLVRMAELYPNSAVLTLDSDFRIYRKNKNQEIPVIMPDIY